LKMNSRQYFPQPFSFFANDYESPNMVLKEGTVSFFSYTSGFEREKTCSIPKTEYSQCYSIWKNFEPKKDFKINFSKSLIPLLEEGLSHIEIIKMENKGYSLIQKDIYTGAKIEIKENNAGNSLLLEGDNLGSFGPIGIRTNDFISLFSFVDSLTWYFQPNHNWVYFSDHENVIEGICATCIYDELGTIGKIGG
jgi:hypothetical protein